MHQATAASRRTGRQLKSPLAAPAYQIPDRAHSSAAEAGLRADRGSLNAREITLSDFRDHLRTSTNRDGLPFADSTIDAYLYPAQNLDRWLTANGIGGDFTSADTALLNRYFREYYDQHGQGGTHTLQRNLKQLFNFLGHEDGQPSPYTAGMHRYSEVKGRPKTLSAGFVIDLLKVTGDGKARDFETARDHAIVRVLRSEGIRRQELLSMVMHTLPADIISNPVLRLVPLKSARAAGEGRLVVLSPATARALAIYLRARRNHKKADSDALWLGTRNRGPLRTTGLRLMLIRRAEQAEYQMVRPHQFRHTFSDAWLASGGSEGDLMRLNGWKSRAMVDRYADDLADQRALQAKRAKGDMF